MNDPQDLQLEQLERELSSLSPARAHPSLMRKLESALQESPAIRAATSTPLPVVSTPKRWAPWAAAAAVTAIAAPVYFSSRNQSAADSPALAIATTPAYNRNASPPPAQLSGLQTALVPVRKIDIPQSSKDEGIIFDVDQGPVRRVRYNYMEHYQYQNQTDGSLLEIRVPRTKTSRTPVIY